MKSNRQHPFWKMNQKSTPKTSQICDKSSSISSFNKVTKTVITNHFITANSKFLEKRFYCLPKPEEIFQKLFLKPCIKSNKEILVYLCKINIYVIVRLTLPKKTQSLLKSKLKSVSIKKSSKNSLAKIRS